MRNLYIATGFLLAGLAGTLVYQPPTGTPASKTKAPPILTKVSKKPVTGPYSILCRSLDSEACELYPEFTKDLDIVIAFAPDPNQTHMRLQFDRTIEAILWAAQDSGYGSFVSYWVPWLVSDPAPYVSLNDQKTAEAEQKRLRKLPGLLLFREGTQYLAVLLVGESPTAGFDREQFDTALRYSTELSRYPKELAERRVPIPILGPCFSGSLNPLQTVIETRKDQFRIYSGTATNVQAEEELKTLLRSQNPKSQYRALSINDDIRVNKLGEYLCPSGIDVECYGRITVLSEDETSFGKKFGGKDSKLSRLSGKRFRFPRGMAYLRNAYQEDPGLLALSTQQFGPPRTSLQLNLKDSETGHDSVPEFAPQTPVSEETQLQQIAEALHHEQVKFAAVISTDVLDRLFVSRYMRAAAPDTRLIFFDSDLIATRSNDGYSLEGTLQVTTYPLFPARHQWLAPPPDDESSVGYRYPFSSEFEEGIYNAARVILAERSEPKPWGLYDYQAPGNSGGPPLWLTTIGRDGYWPISLLALPKDFEDPALYSAEKHKSQFHLAPEHPPRTWWVLFLVSFGLVGSYLVALWYSRSHRDRWCTDFSLKSSEPGACARAFYVLCLTLSMAAAWLTLVSGPIGFFVNGHYEGWVLGLLTMAIGILAVLLACCAVFSHRLVTCETQTPSATRGHYLFLMPIPWALFVAYVWATIRTVLPDSDFGDGHFRGFFYSYRSLEIGSGVSPLVPYLFIFMGLACWSFVQLQRRIFAAERYQLLPHLGQHAVVRGIEAMVEKLKTSLEATFPRPVGPALTATATILILTYVVCRRWAESLEGAAYDRGYSFAVAALASLLCMSVWRLWNSWKLLQAFLEQLDLHPIRAAFDALPAEYSWSPIWQQSPRKRSYVLLARGIDCLRQLNLTVPRTIDPREKEIDDQAKELFACVASAQREDIQVYAKLQFALTGVAQGMVDDLDRGRWTHEESSKLAQEFVALRFLAFIRYAMLQLRNLLTFITFGYVLLVFSLGSYPFQSPHVIAWTLGIALIVITVPVLLVFMAMEKDSVLSRITNTTAGKVDWGFYVRAAAFGVLPLLSVLASHFPAVGQYVFSWVQPLLHSLH